MVSCSCKKESTQEYFVEDYNFMAESISSYFKMLPIKHIKFKHCKCLQNEAKVFLKLDFSFSNFSCISLFFSNLNSNFSNSYDMSHLQEQVKKHSDTKNCSDLSMFE